MREETKPNGGITMTRSDLIGTVIVAAAVAVCAAHTPAHGCDFGDKYPAPPRYEAPTYNPPVYNPPTYTAPIGGAGGAGGAATATATSAVDVKIEDSRDLPFPAPLPEPVQPTFYADPRDEEDFRVIKLADLLPELAGGIEYEEAKRLMHLKAKVADSLLRSRFQQTNWIRFEAPPAGARFLGFCPVYSTSNDITTANLVGAAGVFAMDHGATHAVLVKEGYRRAGTFDGWHIGLGGSAMGIGGDAGASAFGGSASIGPGYTSAESVRVDRPYAVFKLYCDEPTAQATARKE